MIEIMNLRNTKPTQFYDFRIDRLSVLGNSFYMKNESDRDEVCDEYDVYFLNQIKNTDSQFSRKIQEIKIVYIQFNIVRLFCWCAPKRCHGETIRNYILNNI